MVHCTPTLLGAALDATVIQSHGCCLRKGYGWVASSQQVRRTVQSRKGPVGRCPVERGPAEWLWKLQGTLLLVEGKEVLHEDTSWADSWGIEIIWSGGELGERRDELALQAGDYMTRPGNRKVLNLGKALQPAWFDWSQKLWVGERWMGRCCRGQVLESLKVQLSRKESY